MAPACRTPAPRKGPRTGLLGGSFNPAHGGHRRITLFAMEALGLDEAWWLVSPGNPLKPAQGMAPLAARVRSAVRGGGADSAHPLLVGRPPVRAVARLHRCEERAPQLRLGLRSGQRIPVRLRVERSQSRASADGVDLIERHLRYVIEEIEEAWETPFVAETDKAWDAMHRALSDGSLDVELDAIAVLDAIAMIPAIELAAILRDHGVTDLSALDPKIRARSSSASSIDFMPGAKVAKWSLP